MNNEFASAESPALRKDIIFYYLFSFLLGFYIANGTTVLFERVLGFSYSRIFILAAVYMLMFILFEIPSGAFADLLGRKKSIALGCLVLALGALATGLSTTFLQVFLSFFLWAVGFSFISGADEALLYDRVADSGRYTAIFARSRFFFLGATALAGVAGPYLFSVNFRYPYLFSAIPFVLGGLVIMFFREQAAAGRGRFSLGAHWRQIREGLSFAKGNKFVLWSMWLLSLTFAVWYNLSNSYQPFLLDVGFSIRAFSAILPALFILVAVGGMAAGRLNQRLSEGKVFAAGLVFFAAAVGLAGIISSTVSLVFLLLYSFLLGVLRTNLSVYANRHIEPSHRATVISVQGMVATIAEASSLFLFGFLTDRIGISSLLILLGAIALTASLLLLIARP